jgi:hypothetical protein
MSSLLVQDVAGTEIHLRGYLRAEFSTMIAHPDFGDWDSMRQRFYFCAALPCAELFLPGTGGPMARRRRDENGSWMRIVRLAERNARDDVGVSGMRSAEFEFLYGWT